MASMTTYRDESGPGDTTAWTFDPATGLLVQKLYEDGKGLTYTYTPDGKLATRTWARGVTSTYAYDGWGNLTNIVHSDGTPSVSMAYDVMGRQVRTSDAAGITAFSYDSFSSLTNETVSGQYAKSLDRHVDEYSRNIGYSLNGQRKQTIAYDLATGRIANMDGFVWQYLPGTDLKQSLAYPDGTVAEWVYEPRRDLLTLVSNDVFSAYAYDNDAVGRRIAKNSECYGYNVRGELVSVTNSVAATNYTYSFDDIGNRVSADELGTNSAYMANALNQYINIVAEVPFVPEFDDDGNQTLVKTSTGIWNVTYNAENRPIVWSNDTAAVTMDYDRMGRRVWYKSISGTQTNAYVKFVYDGYLCVQQLDGTTGSVDQEFVWDSTETIATRPLVWTLPPTNRTFHYFHDGNKNVSDVIDASDATLTAHYDYAPFGTVTVATGPFAATNPYRFSSEYHDTALGCVYYNFRHYNPLDGRWTARDPIEEAGGVNVYTPFRNNPTGRYDAFGLFSPEPPSIVGKECCDSEGRKGVWECKLASRNDGKQIGGKAEFDAHQKYKRDKAAWDHYWNVSLPLYEEALEEWYYLVTQSGGYGGLGNAPLPPRPIPPTEPPKPVYARNPIMCYNGKPECESGWENNGGPFFWATGKDSAFSGHIIGRGTTTCNQENCFEIESRYMTVAYLLPRRVYYKPDPSNFNYSQWCCRCNVAIK